jgi:hypothetical protein
LVACSGLPSRAEGQWSMKSRESLACRGTVTAFSGLESHHCRRRLGGKGVVCGQSLG